MPEAKNLQVVTMYYCKKHNAVCDTVLPCFEGEVIIDLKFHQDVIEYVPNPSLQPRDFRDYYEKGKRFFRPTNQHLLIFTFTSIYEIVGKVEYTKSCLDSDILEKYL